MKKLTALALAGLGFLAPWISVAPTVALHPPGLFLAENQFDYGLFKQALKSFWPNSSCSTQSTLKITGITQGLSFTGQAKINAIAELPNRFRVQIDFAPNDTGESQSVLLVSNGENFWAYRPDLGQYMVSSASDFQDSDDSFWAGFSTIAFLSVPPELQTLLESTSINSDVMLDALLADVKTLNLQQGKKNIDGSATDTLSLVNQAEGIAITVYLLPPQAQVKAIDLKTDSQGVNLQMIETVQTRTCQANVSPTTFEFQPPATAQKVDQVKISPF